MSERRDETGQPEQLTEAQSEWFISQVKEHARAGIPLACCDEWPECSHMLAWYEAHRQEILGRKGDT